MKFRYLADPLFLTATALYAAIRWWIVPLAPDWTFARAHGTDLLLIPCLLPPVLWAQKRLGHRQSRDQPRLWEIVLHAALWSVLFEWVAPAAGFGWPDWRDAVAYFAGGFVAWTAWRWYAPDRPGSSLRHA